MKTITEQFPDFIKQFPKAKLPLPDIVRQFPKVKLLPRVPGDSRFLDAPQEQVVFHTIPYNQKVPLHAHDNSWAVMVSGELETTSYHTGGGCETLCRISPIVVHTGKLQAFYLYEFNPWVAPFA